MKILFHNRPTYLIPRPWKLSQKQFPPKWSLLNALSKEKKIEARKAKKEGRRESEKKSQDCCGIFEPSQDFAFCACSNFGSEFLDLDQAVKSATCKRICGKI